MTWAPCSAIHAVSEATTSPTISAKYLPVASGKSSTAASMVAEVPHTETIRSPLFFIKENGVTAAALQKRHTNQPIRMHMGGTSYGNSCHIKKKKERQRQPAPTNLKRSEKIVFDFCQFVLHFWLRLLDAVLMNTMFIVQE